MRCENGRVYINFHSSRVFPYNQNFQRHYFLMTRLGIQRPFSLNFHEFVYIFAAQLIRKQETGTTINLFNND
jgi:hypothetical protein